MCDINIEMIFGHYELKQFNKFENGRMFSYGYSICYDSGRKAVSCTIPESLSSIGWDDGSPFTEVDYHRLSDNGLMSRPATKD